MYLSVWSWGCFLWLSPHRRAKFEAVETTIVARLTPALSGSRPSLVPTSLLRCKVAGRDWAGYVPLRFSTLCAVFYKKTSNFN
jgi:hypothetical protein